MVGLGQSDSRMGQQGHGKHPTFSDCFGPQMIPPRQFVLYLLSAAVCAAYRLLLLRFL